MGLEELLEVRVGSNSEFNPFRSRLDGSKGGGRGVMTGFLEEAAVELSGLTACNL